MVGGLSSQTGVCEHRKKVSMTSESPFNYLGYSERGMVNALCDDIAHAPKPLEAVAEFVSWFKFPTSQPDSIKHATILVEQSFSDFGDLDLLILLQFNNSPPQAVMVEAKVSTDTDSWITVEDRWEEFLRLLDGGEGSTSNLFVQLHRKVRLVQHVRSDEKAFTPDIFTPRGSLGLNRVVRKAADELKKYLQGDPWYGAILPDDAGCLEAFARDTFIGSAFQQLPAWSTDRWAFLSWQEIAKSVDAAAGKWPRTKATFEWNQGQIFRSKPPTQHSVEKGQILCLGEEQVYVVSVRGGQNCGVVPLKPEHDEFFWKASKVRVADLQPCPPPAPVAAIPALPRQKHTYTWNAGTDTPRLPPESAHIDITADATVVVMNASWFTSRVRKATDPDDTSGFLVFTHHLKRASGGN